MSYTADTIKSLGYRIELNKDSTKKGAMVIKNKKIATKLVNELRKEFADFFVEEEDQQFVEIFENLSSSQIINPYISSNFFPFDMEEYGHYENIAPFSKDFRFEIRWIICCVAFYKDAINAFLAAREEYDNLILLNKYEDALKVIEEVEYKLGVSFWSMECKFFLYPKLGKSNEELLKTMPMNTYGAILNFYELKNRENVTSDEYFYIVGKEVNSVKSNLTGYDNVIEFYNYMISSIMYQGTPENIMKLLPVVRRGSLIDRYLFLINVCNYLVNLPEENYFYVSVQNYIQLLSQIEDDHLIALRFMLDTEERRKSEYILKSRLDAAKEYFINGDLENTRHEALKLLKLFPNNTEAMNLYVETNILIDDNNDEFADTNLGTLLNKLSSVYRLTSDRDDCMEIVNKLSICCGQSTWSKSIINSVLSRCQEYGEFDYKRTLILSNIQHLDIETMISCLPEEECIRFIDEKINTQDNYILFRKAILEKDFQKAIQICKVEQVVDLLYIFNDANSIEKKMEYLHPIEGNGATIAIRGMKYFLSVIDLNENIDIAMQIATNLVIDNIFTSLFIPLEKMASYVDKGPDNIRQNICTPILYYVFAYYFNKDKIDDLGIICEDFFLSEDIERPSKMEIYNYDKKLLIYFLRNVCSTKIMDVSLCTFKNQMERDNERVEILNVLSHIDAANAKDYENEIREITQKLMINAELKIIEENRIHVNVDGMRDTLEEKYKNDFMRYMFYQDERFRQMTFLLEGDSTQKIKMIQDAPERILNELILHIRDAFVSSDEYGLNGYLSLNIRHGTLEDELRSPLSKAMLTAKKDVKTNQYVINEYWTDYVDRSDAEKIRKAITDFHIATEKIILKLKKDYIQISTEDKKTKGIFEYHFNDMDILQISLQMQGISTFNEFLDMMISYLWAITERNLESIKYVITNEILQDYNDSFAQLKNDISDLTNKKKLRDLQQKISEASTDMPNVLDRFCYWFQRSTESKHNDFDIQFAFNLGLQTIKNMHPERTFNAVEIEKTESDKIPGYYLKNFDGIFYNLFDNIYKKASQKNGVIEIRYALRCKDGKVRIYIENDYDCTKDISDDKARVEEAKQLISTDEYLKRAKGEGGTGIPKICKIVRYDLNLYPYIDFGYKEQEKVFYMEIKF